MEKKEAKRKAQRVKTATYNRAKDDAVAAQ